MSEALISLWKDLNKDFFQSNLKPVAEISWQEISGDEGIGAFGLYRHKSRIIIIDNKFQFDERLFETDEQERLKCECTFRILLHEMVHQSLHEQNSSNPGGHGEPFILEASRVAAILRSMGHTVEEPSLKNSKTWPGLP